MTGFLKAYSRPRPVLAVRHGNDGPVCALSRTSNYQIYQIYQRGKKTKKKKTKNTYLRFETTDAEDPASATLFLSMPVFLSGGSAGFG